MLLLTLLALVVTGCGKTTEESQPITLNTGLESPVEIPIFGKKLTLKTNCTRSAAIVIISIILPVKIALTVRLSVSTSITPQALGK